MLFWVCTSLPTVRSWWSCDKNVILIPVTFDCFAVHTASFIAHFEVVLPFCVFFFPLLLVIIWRSLTSRHLILVTFNGEYGDFSMLLWVIIAYYALPSYWSQLFPWICHWNVFASTWLISGISTWKGATQFLSFCFQVQSFCSPYQILTASPGLLVPQFFLLTCSLLSYVLVFLILRVGFGLFYVNDILPDLKIQ